MKYIMRLVNCILIFFLIASILYSENIYKDLQKSESLYNNKEYSKSVFYIKRILNEYPDYDEAKLLYLKISYEEEKYNKNFDRLYFELLSGSSNVKEDMFFYFIYKNDIDKSIELFDVLEEKEKHRKVLENFLFNNRSYKSLLKIFPESKYISRIESFKLDADKKYVNALSSLKESKVDQAIQLLLESIKIYPFNYVYYLKLAQVYADKKNYYLSEKNLKEALNYSDSSEIYLTLFKIYYEQGLYEDIYRFINKVYVFPEVRGKLLEIVRKEKKNDLVLSIIKKDGKYIYVNKTFIKDIAIGKTYFLGKIIDKVFDHKTLENLTYVKEIYAKVRVYNIENKAAVLYIIEEKKKVRENEEYILY